MATEGIQVYAAVLFTPLPEYGILPISITAEQLLRWIITSTCFP